MLFIDNIMLNLIRTLISKILHTYNCAVPYTSFCRPISTSAFSLQPIILCLFISTFTYFKE